MRRVLPDLSVVLVPRQGNYSFMVGILAHCRSNCYTRQWSFNLPEELFGRPGSREAEIIYINHLVRSSDFHKDLVRVFLNTP